MKRRSPRAPWVIGSVVLMVSCSGGEALGGGPSGAARPRASKPSLLLMTYNVNFGTAGDPDTIELIRAAAADVVLLQETNPGWERALRAGLADRYRHMAFHHSPRRAGGLGFLSRHPLELEQLQESPIGWFPAWRAVVDTPLGRIQLLNLHLRPPGRDGGSFVRAYFTRQVERLSETEAHIGLLDPSLPSVVAGDFNEDARGRSILFLAGRGLDSALERFHPAQPTWRWQTRMGLVRWQLDHILLGPALRATAAWVIDGGASDHVPVLARIEPGR
ncbi:MAG TPA: endonuclease/exonuclease/phosphatase family protein [Kofleriaceae bacterium]|nr:endonuclease/exonuclease/phosphatase family protein [Kofleriaceae bacterium]